MKTMKDIKRKFVAPLALAVLSSIATLVLVAQSAPALDQGYTGAVTVSGRVAPGSGPVTIYDISYPVQTKLGISQAIDRDGNFAASIKPPLILGHQIVAVDTNGTTSDAMIVADLPDSPA